MESFGEHSWPRPGWGSVHPALTQARVEWGTVLGPAPPPPGKLGGWVLPNSKGSLSAQPLPFPSLPGEQMAALSLSAVGGQAGQAGGASGKSEQPWHLATGTPEPGLLRAPGSHPLPPRREPLCVCIPLRLQTSPPDPSVTIPGKVLMTALPCGRLTEHRPEIPSPQPRGVSASTGAWACDLGMCTPLLLAHLLARLSSPFERHQPRGPQDRMGLRVASSCASPAPGPRPQASSSPQKKSLHSPYSALEPEARARPNEPRAGPLERKTSLLGAGRLSQEWVGRREGYTRQGPRSVWPPCVPLSLEIGLG